MKGIPGHYGGDATSSRAIYPSSKQSWYITLLVSCKALNCVAIFLAYDLMQKSNIVSFVCFLKLIFFEIAYTMINRFVNYPKLGYLIDLEKHNILKETRDL
ncbi:unnamed protein product, partial [Timema podura]|nr:unnamed protein product [Timema podura]